MKVKVVTGGNTSDRIFSAWVGASILASLGNFQVSEGNSNSYEHLFVKNIFCSTNY